MLKDTMSWSMQPPGKIYCRNHQGLDCESLKMWMIRSDSQLALAGLLTQKPHSGELPPGIKQFKSMTQGLFTMIILAGLLKP